MEGRPRQADGSGQDGFPGKNNSPLALSRAAGCGTGKRGKLFERSEFLPRRLRSPSTGVVSAAGLPFLLVLFFGQAKKRTPPGRGAMAIWWGWRVRGGVFTGWRVGRIRDQADRL